ncbi:MAG: dienelactone hydrolase family protein [Actinobacteria bacterium]|nr:dienelactone hydrolase family protein [Actinomycetota bacterium]
MGEMVEFKSNGGTCTGYLAGTSGPGVIVIQEWWGLVPHITDIADRFAAEGFVALAPDMYHGEATDEPDLAGKLLMSMNLATAGKDLSGAVDLLQERTGRTKVGVTGFCMGGGLALMAACLRPDAIAAAAPEAVKELEATLRAKGKNATFHVYPGTQHAFFNDTRPEVYDAAVAKTAWDRTLALFRANL